MMNRIAPKIHQAAKLPPFEWAMAAGMSPITAARNTMSSVARRDDATAMGQIGRQKIFNALLVRLDEQAS